MNSNADIDSSPLVSIIMPTYNRGKFISETIGSICNQTYQHWELIIVDDGSEDNTEQIIEQLKDERIKFYKTAHTGIVGKLKNKGIKNSSGEFIAFIDSDDLWASTKIEKQVGCLRKYSGAGFSITGGYNFKDNLVPVDYFFTERQGIKYDHVFISFFESGLPAYTQALMLRRSCLAIAGNFLESKSFSDVEFILSLAKSFKAVILYEALFYRRLHQDNDSRLNWEERYHEGINIIERYKMDLPAKIMHNAMFRLHMNFGEDHLMFQEEKKAMLHFFIAWKNRPASFIPAKKIAKAIIQYFIKK